MPKDAHIYNKKRPVQGLALSRTLHFFFVCAGVLRWVSQKRPI